MAKHIPMLTASSLVLRPLTEADLPTTRYWRNRDDVRRWFVHSGIITPDSHAAWFEQYQRRDNDLMWVIESGGVPCGQVGLYDIDQDTAEFGRFMIGEPAMRGTGIGRAACLMLTRYALDLGLACVRLHVLAHNVRAIQVYRDCGYRSTAEQPTPGITRMERVA